jgi:glycosyltransferase involved in cell wall biosynthesis
MLVPPGGISQISDTLRVLLSNKDLRLRLGTAARQTVLERFAVQHQARRLAEIYDGCLA